MEFALDSDQEAIVELARNILTDHCGDDQLRAFAASGQPYDADLWRVLAEAGLTGVGVAEDLGGTGFGMIETAFLLEQAGIALAPVPLRETLVCAQTLAMLGSAHAPLIGEAATGRAILASHLTPVRRVGAIAITARAISAASCRVGAGSLANIRLWYCPNAPFSVTRPWRHRSHMVSTSARVS